MIVAPELTLRDLMTQIVQAAHGLTDELGTPQVMPTIDEPRLRMAAITAMQIATGEPVWPGDRKIVIRRPDRDFGIFQHVR